MKKTRNTRSTTLVAALLAGFAVASAVSGRAAAALTTPQMVDILKIVDDRQKNNGDWRASAYLEQKEKDKVDIVYETEFYRRVQYADARFSRVPLATITRARA